MQPTTNQRPLRLACQNEQASQENTRFGRSGILHHQDFRFNQLRKNTMVKDLVGIGRSDHPVIKNPELHTMGDSLYEYLSIKMHNYIFEKRYKRILVVGMYDRTKEIATNEKGRKQFNWQRPTAELIGDDLFIKCPIGPEYIQHYASLIGSYLYLIGKDGSCVSYCPPTEEECTDFIERSNLRHIRPSEFVVYGFGLPQVAKNKQWKGGGPFWWTKKKIRDTEVTFLGCDYCVWGDISGRMVKYLAEKKKIRKFIYVGKLGSLKPSCPPNTHLATGTRSLINGKLVEWDGLFDSNSRLLLI